MRTGAFIRRWWFWALAVLFSMSPLGLEAAEAPAKAAPAKKPVGTDAFMRIVDDARGQPKAMQTAIVRCTPIKTSTDADGDGPTVDLIAAVHIGDRAYYERLNREFAKYDVVLYELVAPLGTRVPKGAGSRSNHPIGMLQRFMKDVLELDLQLDVVDYSAKNFVHADMSAEQLSDTMERTNDSLWSMMIRAMGASLAQPDKQMTDADLLVALLNPNRTTALRRTLAKQMQGMDFILSAVEGPNGSALIAERNKVALGVLREQMDKGEKRIAIFYGGGHMPDMQRRLHDDFQMEPTETRWLDAWDLRMPEKSAK